MQSGGHRCRCVCDIVSHVRPTILYAALLLALLTSPARHLMRAPTAPRRASRHIHTRTHHRNVPILFKNHKTRQEASAIESAVDQPARLLSLASRWKCVHRIHTQHTHDGLHAAQRTCTIAHTHLKYDLIDYLRIRFSIFLSFARMQSIIQINAMVMRIVLTHVNGRMLKIGFSIIKCVLKEEMAGHERPRACVQGYVALSPSRRFISSSTPVATTADGRVIDVR